MAKEQIKKAPKAAKVPSKAPKTAPSPKAAAPKAAVSAMIPKAAVVITSSKVCQAFAKRAAGLSAAIKAAKPGASVTIDEKQAEGRKPDRGSFVVSVGGTEVVSCKSMARPFAAMKALDMDAVAKKVIALL
jgi:hypothetical protein